MDRRKFIAGTLAVTTLPFANAEAAERDNLCPRGCGWDHSAFVRAVSDLEVRGGNVVSLSGCDCYPSIKASSANAFLQSVVKDGDSILLMDMRVESDKPIRIPKGTTHVVIRNCDFKVPKGGPWLRASDAVDFSDFSGGVRVERCSFSDA